MTNTLKKETERLLSIDMPPHIRIIFGDHEKHIRDLQAEVDRLAAVSPRLVSIHDTLLMLATYPDDYPTPQFKQLIGEVQHDLRGLLEEIGDNHA